MKDFQDQFLKAVHSGQFNDWFDTLLPAGTLDGMGVFRTYHMDYSSRLSHALTSSYPAIAQHLGHDFALLCQEYILAHPSHHNDLGQLGQGLEAFLRTHALAHQYPFLPDLAALEWAIERLFHEPTPVIAELNLALATEAFLSLHFDFVPHQIIPSVHGLFALWKHSLATQDDAGVLVGKTPQGVQVLSLNASRLLLMQVLSAGQSLGEALEALLKQLNDDALVERAVADIQALFLQLRQHGFLAAVKKPA
jgi:uncharacterized protein